MIAMYDLEDNFITLFDTYQECADYFETSKKVIQTYICKNRKGKIDKKWDKKNNCHVRLFKIEE